MSARLLLLSLLAAGCGAVDNGDDGGGPTDDAAVTTGDLAGQKPADMTAPKAGDMAGQKAVDMATIPQGTVGPTGGTVDRLFFAFHGDTRPMDCNDTANYPSTVIQNIYTREEAAQVQFDVSLGDYMFVCGSQLFTTATDQMNLYTTASALLKGKTHFLVMGNHECEASGVCPVGSADPNSKAFYAALKPISPLAYYSFNVKTSQGLATFVSVADNAWDATQQTWLTQTLTTADANAKYTIVMRHHPIDNTDLPTNMTSWGIIHAHKYSLFLTGHSHEYKHDTYNDNSRRTIVMGAGGALPFDGNGMFYAYGTVEQEVTGTLSITVYDATTGNIQDSFTVAPQ